MEMEELKNQIQLKDKEISLLLTYCNDIKKTSEHCTDFNEMIDLLKELSKILKENLIYQEYINQSQNDELQNDSFDYIKELKLLIEWFKNQNEQYQVELINKNNELKEMVDMMDQLFLEKEKDIEDLTKVINLKNMNYYNVCDSLKTKQNELTHMSENYENEIFELHQNIQNNYNLINQLNDLIKTKDAELKLLNDTILENQNLTIKYDKYIKDMNGQLLKLKDTKTELINIGIDRDVEIYKLYNELSEKEHLIEEKDIIIQEKDIIIEEKNSVINEKDIVIEQKNQVINELENDEIFINPLYIDEKEIENAELRAQLQQHKFKIDELNKTNKQQLELINNIKIFIDDSKKSSFFIFNPGKTVESIVSLFNDNIYFNEFGYKNHINLINRC